MTADGGNSHPLTTTDLAEVRNAIALVLRSGLAMPAERDALHTISNRTEARIGEIWKREAEDARNGTTPQPRDPADDPESVPATTRATRQKRR
jgi:hypothetical protein